jgi:hypothetical protein
LLIIKGLGDEWPAIGMKKWSLINLNEKYGDCYFSYDNNFLNQKDVNKCNNMYGIDDCRGKRYGSSSSDSSGNYENNLNSSKFHNIDGSLSVNNNNDIYNVNNSKDLGIQEINTSINEEINEPKVMKLNSFLKGINYWNHEQSSNFYEKNSRDLHSDDTHKISDIDDAHVKTVTLNKDVNGSGIPSDTLVKGGNEERNIVDYKQTKKNHEKMLKYSPNPPYIFDSTFDFGDSESMSHEYKVPSIFNGTFFILFLLVYCICTHIYEDTYIHKCIIMYICI